MKKLVTALFIVLPMIFIVAIFAVTSFSLISANIPAASLVINNKSNDGSGIYHFDMAKDGISPISESELGIEVLPLGASNRKFSLRSILTPGTGEPTDCVTRLDDGAFRLNGIGDAVLTYASDDGGFTDSVIFSVSASDVTDFVPHIFDVNRLEQPIETQSDGTYTVRLKSGRYTVESDYIPQGASPSFQRFATSSVGIDVNEVTGQLSALFSGESYLTVFAGSIASPKNIRLEVEKAGDVTINGFDIEDAPRLSGGTHSRYFTFMLEAEAGVTKDSIEVQNANVNDFAITPIEGKNGCFEIRCTLKTPYEQGASETYTLSIGGSPYSFHVDFSDYEFEVLNGYESSGSDLTLFAGSEAMTFTVLNTQGAKLEYEWEIDQIGTSYAKIIETNGAYCKIKPLAIGTATLTVRWRELDGEASGTITRSLNVVIGYSSLSFGENSQTTGLGERAIARYEYVDGKLVEKHYLPDLKAKELFSQTVSDKLMGGTFTSSAPSVVEVGESDGKPWLQVKGNGAVTITASWNVGGRSVSTSFSFKAVDGVWARDYDSLRRAMSDKIPTVLGEDIYLGEQLFNVQRDDSGNIASRSPKYSTAEMNGKLLSYTGEIDSTWDCKYLENVNEPHKLRYALELTANVYGNGHFINAEYITDMLDGAGKLYDFAVFKGPLDFVATSQSGISASVKGQDNICFLIKTDGITIDNVILKGCDDEAIKDVDDNGNVSTNLSYLNYVGTVLEIMSDATIINSRVNNGRTVLRAYGREGISEATPVNAASERIHVTIEGCVLSYAREFILKVGTNRLKRGAYSSAADTYSSLFDANGKEYDLYNQYGCDGYINDEYFMDNYVLTDVMLKDSVLDTSGLFSVGMECHFAGGVLETGSIAELNYTFEGWSGIAATSYPAILRVVGNVEFKDWKVLKNIDSTTLIETDISNPDASWLSLNVAAMLETVCDLAPDTFGDIILNRDGEKFVHGGIALYGGGKNYSIVDFSEYTGAMMSSYNINISNLRFSDSADIRRQGILLPFAAGIGDFRFIMFGANSEYLPN